MSCATGAVRSQLLMRLGERRRVVENAQVRAHLAARGAQFERLGDPDRPGHQRGEGEPDHDQLHHDDRHPANMPHGDRSWGSSARLTEAWPGGDRWPQAPPRSPGALAPGGRRRGGRRGRRRGRRCRSRRSSRCVGAAGAAAFCARADWANGVAVRSALPSTTKAEAPTRRNRCARRSFCIANGPLCWMCPQPTPNGHGVERM